MTRWAQLLDDRAGAVADQRRIPADRPVEQVAVVDRVEIGYAERPHPVELRALERRKRHVRLVVAWRILLGVELRALLPHCPLLSSFSWGAAPAPRGKKRHEAKLPAHSILLSKISQLTMQSIKKRLILLVAIALVGAMGFLPFIQASGTELPRWAWVVFPLVSAAIVAVLGGFGLRFADQSGLPMPLLRLWEDGCPLTEREVKRLWWPLLAGAVLGGLIVGLNLHFKPPVNHGSVVVRLLITPWAAVVTETISHLFVLSGLYLLVKSKLLALLGSSAVFVVLFHLNGVGGDTTLAVYLGAANLAGILLTGWLYYRQGFEAAIIGHAAMHAVLLAVG